ncbi:MAG TPA: ribosome silencing factor [Candidatus Cryosericum sp.]|nr:ribosome silencing factor [Candidatus Cryosericum sp.]
MALVLEAAEEKKAENPVAIRLKGIATFTDGFIICTGAQRRQTQAICDAIVERLKAAGERTGHIEGYGRGEWILIDLYDLIVHVFTPETRDFYGLERLWGDAPRVEPLSSASPSPVLPRVSAGRRGAGGRRATAGRTRRS